MESRSEHTAASALVDGAVKSNFLERRPMLALGFFLALLPGTVLANDEEQGRVDHLPAPYDRAEPVVLMRLLYPGYDPKTEEAPGQPHDSQPDWAPKGRRHVRLIDLKAWQLDGRERLGALVAVWGYNGYTTGYLTGTPSCDLFMLRREDDHLVVESRGLAVSPCIGMANSLLDDHPTPFDARHWLVGVHEYSGHHCQEDSWRLLLERGPLLRPVLTVKLDTDPDCGPDLNDFEDPPEMTPRDTGRCPAAPVFRGPTYYDLQTVHRSGASDLRLVGYDPVRCTIVDSRTFRWNGWRYVRREPPARARASSSAR